MNIHKFPILKFLKLLQNDDEGRFSFGLEEYLVVFESIQGGFGISNLEGLRRTLMLLVVKNEVQATRFDYLFKYVEEDYKTIVGILTRYQNETEKLDINDPNQGLEIAKEEIVDIAEETIDTPIDQEMDNSANIEDIEPQIEEEINYPEKSIEQSALTVSDNYSSKLPTFKKRLFKYSFKSQSLEKDIGARGYFPASIRDIKNSFRYLRLKNQLISSSENLDLQATIEKICRESFFLNPIYENQKINQIELFFLIDCSKSMIPFSPIINDITQSYPHPVKAHKVYFDNFPNQYLYYNSNRKSAVSIERFLATSKVNYFFIMLSDAGAARGTFNEFRITQTLEFINQLYLNTRHFVWFNPVPKERWVDNTAFVFKSMNVPMFPIDVWNFRNGIDFLRNKY